MTCLSHRIDDRLAAADARLPFLVVDGVATPYARMIDRLRRSFGYFEANGLRSGDRVGVISTSTLDVATLMLAGIRYGLGMINLNPDVSARDGLTALAACRLSHIFVDAAIFERLVMPQGVACTVIGGPAPKRGGGLFRMLRSEPPAGLEAVLADAIPSDAPPRPPVDATAMMLFTSGTTSAPKVVELSHANLAAQLDVFDHIYDYDSASRILNPLPLHFTDGMLHGPLASFVAGATLYRPNRFDFQKLEDLVHGVYRDRITHFIVVPALLALLDRLGDAFHDAFAGRDFRYIRSSGDLLPERLWRAVEKRFKVRVVNTWGMSETVCEALFCGPSDATHRVGTIGKPAGCEARIVDDAGAAVAVGVTGELLIRGDIVMKGYLDQPVLTATGIVDGWLHSGDFATQDAEGFVTIVGRKKSLIIAGGVNVQPQDVVDCLLDHPAVAEAVAFGVPHAMWGEQVAAAVRLRDGAAASVPALIKHCEAQLSPHKTPRLIAVVDELPRNAAGKVLIDPLRAQLTTRDQSVGSASDVDLFGQVQRIAASVFAVPVEELRPTSDPATTLGWDSLAHLDLIAATEAHFDVRLSAADVLRIHDLNDLVGAVKRLRAG